MAIALLIYVCFGSTAHAASVCETNFGDVLVLPGNFSRPTQSSFTNVSDAPALQSLQACQFISFDPRFNAILGPDPSVSQLSSSKNYSFAHEAATYLPGGQRGRAASHPTVASVLNSTQLENSIFADQNAVFFSSDRQGNKESGDTYVELWTVDLANGSLRELLPSSPVPQACIFCS